jgi:AMMECR1 domain-containing protein
LDGPTSTAKGPQKYSATFLPEVPVEQGWSKRDTFDHLIAKSGFPKTHSWLDLLQEFQDQESLETKNKSLLKKKIKIIKYESIKGHLHHSDYLNKKQPQTSPE